MPAWPTEEGPATCSLWAYGQWTSAHSHQQANCYFARSCLLSPDKQRQAEDREKQSSAQPISSGAGVNNDNTTRLSPLIKGYKQRGQEHPPQAMALVECCTSVTQNWRRAGIIRVATLVRGTTASPNLNAYSCSINCWISTVAEWQHSSVGRGAASEEATAEICDLQTALIMFCPTDDLKV